jgi:ABC-type uncharacterized transport system ATPase subunit
VSELQLRDISKRFGSVAALDHAQLNVDHGTVHALLGENGAGKTTLMRIAYGMIRPDSGAVLVDGVEQKFASPADALAAGIGMVQQHYALVDRMTVAENVALVRTVGTAARDWRYSADQAARAVRQIGEEVGLELDPAARVGDLSIAGQQRVEIFKALARSARILILDEPTAVLAPAEAAQLLAWLRRVANSGRTVVLITHKLRDALGVADNVTVLRQGRTVATMPARSATEDSLAVAMLGSAPPIATKPTRSTPGAPVIRADRIDIVDARGVLRVHEATFVVHAGEIVGIAAVEGEGQIPLLQAIAGRRRVAAGRLEAPADIGFVPEDRLRDALIEDFPLYENVYLRGAGRARGLVQWAAQRQATATLLERFDIRAAGPNVSARTLSGGNQQRLILGRELGGAAGAAASIIALNPTRGLDIQATAAIQDRLLAARDAGAAIVLYSSDLDEVLELADRVLVLAHRTVQEIPPPFDRDLVGRAMLGLR